MNSYSRAINPVFGVTLWVTVSLLSLMVILETYEISSRLYTGNTPIWSKELVLLFMVWMGCLGSAWLHRERGHITIEFLVDLMPRKARRVVMLMADCLILVFASFLLVAGAAVTLEFLNQSLPGTRMPVGLSYLPLPVTGLLLCLGAVEHILSDLSSDEEPKEDAA